MRRIAEFMAYLLLLCCATAYAGDAIREKLNAGKAAYDLAMEKFRDSANDWFNRQEREAREKGSKQRVDQLKVQRQAFEERDGLPETAPAALKRTLHTVQSNMEAAYRRAITDYTKSKQDEEATAIERELDHFKKNEFSDTLDRVQVGTVWEGGGSVVSETKPNRADFRASLTILERNGDRFKARFESATVRRVINGHIKGRQIWWNKEDVTVEKGPDRGVDNFGYINNTRIQMRHQGRTDSGVATLGITDFRLNERK